MIEELFGMKKDNSRIQSIHTNNKRQAEGTENTEIVRIVSCLTFQ